MVSTTISLLVLLLLLLPLTATSQINGTLTLGSSLSTQNETSPLVSPSGDFAFGFYRLPGEEDGFLLAIWFDRVATRDVIWWADGDFNPLKANSKVELTKARKLVVYDHKGMEVWTRENVNGGVVSAAMLDTGNLVLQNSSSATLWGSFDEPTNTILPGQILEFSGKLSSRSNRSIHSLGKFELRLLPDGNLVLNTIALPTISANDAFFWSNTYQTGMRLIYNQSGDIYILLRDGNRTDLGLMNLPANSSGLRDFYLRATLDDDGVFRQYSFPRRGNQNNRSQPQQWSVLGFIPQDICSSRQSKLGSGICGFNSYCSSLPEGRYNCQCSLGFSSIDPEDTRKGCKPLSVQSCRQNSSSQDQGFEMNEISGIDWPEQDYDRFSTGVTKEMCRASCMDDCLCTVAIYGDQTCWKKKLPLSNGRVGLGLGRTALIKVKNDTKPRIFESVNSQDKIRGSLVIAGSLLLGSSVFLNVMVLVPILWAIYFSYPRDLPTPKTDSAMFGKNLRLFTYKELEEATDGFRDEVGRGGFGAIYRGIMHGTLIAVKKLDQTVAEGEKELRMEVAAIGRTHHKNLVKLIGFCDEQSHRLLVYEFMENGSLASFLFGNSRPRWEQRIQIAFGIARGLTYLHEECRSQIIHCDVKPENILLDENFNPKISDFGLAKLLKTDQSRTMTAFRGTRGYVAPEWLKKMAITSKVDVYSFGVMLLEMVCCRKNREFDKAEAGKEVLTDWAYCCYREGKVGMLVEEDDDAMRDGLKVETLIKVAIWCVQEEPSLRPTMKKVTQMLEGAVDVPSPPHPCSFISSLA